jgi:chemotaxis signal transduction protein
MVGKTAEGFITGVGKMEGKLILTIDSDRILSSEEMNQIASNLEGEKEEPALNRA